MWLLCEQGLYGGRRGRSRQQVFRSRECSAARFPQDQQHGQDTGWRVHHGHGLSSKMFSPFFKPLLGRLQNSIQNIFYSINIVVFFSFFCKHLQMSGMFYISFCEIPQYFAKFHVLLSLPHTREEMELTFAFSFISKTYISSCH